MQTSTPAGGTTVEVRGKPIVPIAIFGGVVVVVLVLYFAFRGGSTPAAATPAPGPAPTAAPGPAPAANAAPAPAPVPGAPAPAAANAPSPDAVAAELERSLKRKHLWSTVAVVGDHLEVRSGSCRDPQMAPELAGIAGPGKAAGLTRLRCLEQSGTVVMERDF